jgi:hypothetical protein
VHHIVPRSDNRFEESRAAMELLDGFGIDRNDPANGVALPRPYHQGLHSQRRYAELQRELAVAQSRDDALLVLRDFAERYRAEAGVGPSGAPGLPGGSQGN